MYALRFVFICAFYKPHDLRRSRIIVQFLNSGFQHAVQIDASAEQPVSDPHSDRIRFSCQRLHINCSRSACHNRINRDLVSRMQYDRLSQIQLLRRNNLFCVSDFQVRIFRTNINKFRNRFFRPAQRDFFYKFSDLIKEHRRNGFFVTSYKKCSYSRYDHQ